MSNEDINVVEFYDHFASHVLLQYEQFGFCGKGEASDLVQDGAMRLDGRFPTCTDGGNLSFSHPGAPMMFRPIEVVRQLRGEVKDLCPGWEAGEHTFDPGALSQDPRSEARVHVQSRQPDAAGRDDGLRAWGLGTAEIPRGWEGSEPDGRTMR